MDSYIHCTNLESKIEDQQLLEQARDYAWLEYTQDVQNPYNIENFLNRLVARKTISSWAKTKYPTVGDIVVVPSQELATSDPSKTYNSRHAMCIIGMHEGDFIVAIGGNLYDVMPQQDHHIYYTFR